MKTKIFLAFACLALAALGCKEQTASNNPSVKTTDTANSKMVGTAKATVKKESVSAFLQAAKILAESTRKEQGNLFYQYYQEPNDSTHFIFVEEFKSEAALGEHSASAYFQDFVKQAPTLLSEPLDVKFYSVKIK